MKWTKREVNIIKTAVKKIEQGMSIYSQVRRLWMNLLGYRSWESIMSKIYRERQKFEKSIICSICGQGYSRRRKR